MIITLIFIIILVLGIIIMRKFSNQYDNDLDGVGYLLIVVGSILLSISLIIIIVNHSTANKTIRENKIEYDGLYKRYEVIQSEYEDVSKSQVIADITEWNKDVYNTKYWAENPWTNWFNSKSVADNLAYIPLEGEE